MRLTSLFLTAALGVAGWIGLSPAASAQGSSTPVIGYYKFNVPRGSSAWVSGFVTRKEFQGQASSVTGGGTTSTIQQANGNWTAGQFNLHYIEVLDGPWAGLVLDIVGNSASSLTIDGNLGAGGFNLAQNVQYCVRKHATLGQIFEGGAGLVGFEDSLTLFYDDGTKKSFYYDDTPPGRIVSDDFATDKSNEIVYPGQGMLITTGGARTLTFGGNAVSYVKDTPTRIPLYGSRINLVGRISPMVGATPLQGGLAANEQVAFNSPALGLISSRLSDYEDEILHFALNPSGVFTRVGLYYYDSEQNAIVNDMGSRVSASLPHGAALILRPTGDRYYTQPGVSLGN